MHPSLRAKYDFRWDVLDVIIGGRSSIDSPQGYPMQSLEEAGRFIQSYGYDLDNPIENAEVQGNYREALSFIRKNFLQPENPAGIRLEIPRKIQELQDMRELLVMAGQGATGGGGNVLRHWACSLLKVMHTISHIDKDLRTSYFADVQQQIFDRVYKVVHRDAEKNLLLGESLEDPMAVRLFAFETKPKKSRDSIVLKLLHKPENVAEDIFDRVGIRFVTHTPLDAVRVVKFLRERMIIMPPNIKPSRSRNTLLDMDVFKAALADGMARSEAGVLDEKGLVRELDEASQPPATNPDNPHSSEFYRAIQFTSRQLIKLRNPLYDDLKELKQLSRAKGAGANEDFARTIDRIDLKHLQREVKFFYPFEVQVLDARSAEENERGRSAHSEYKKAQVQTALKRVMGSLADAAPRG